jgi:phage tail-like protein
VPSTNERDTATPVTGACFSVHIGERELAVARVSAPTLAVDRASLTARPVPADEGRVNWSGEPQTGSLVLTRAVDGDPTLYRWQRQALAATPREREMATRDVVIRLLDPSGLEPVATFELVCAWPVRWIGPKLDGLSSELAIEELEVVYADLLLR